MVETQQLIWVAGLNRWDTQLISTLNTAPILNQSIHVSKTGSDDLGNGTVQNPYLTISYALSAIVGNNENVRYAIYVSPGEYSDPWLLKPWVAIVGSDSGDGSAPNGASLVEISAPLNSLNFNSEWSSSNYSVSWMTGLGFKYHQTWEQDGYMKPQLNFDFCSFNDGVSFLAPATTSFDRVVLNNCLIYGLMLIQGWQELYTQNCIFRNIHLSISSGTSGGVNNTIWFSQGDSIGLSSLPADVILVSDGYGLSASADISNTSVVGNLTIQGMLTSYKSTVEGIPCSVSLLDGANSPVLMSCSDGLFYLPIEDAYWTTIPTSVSNALDQLAERSNTISSTSNDYSMFFALMPGDNSATVAPGTALQFPQDGPTNGAILRTGPSTFNLPNIGVYEVTWQASINEAGQLQLALNGIGLANTVVGRASGTSQLFGNVIINTSVVNSHLSIINPAGNSTALTVTPIAGGTHSVSATLSIKSL